MKDSKQAKGGRARAAKLSAEELSNIGRVASNARWGTAMKATYSGEINIGNQSISCAVLENGTRVLTQGGFMQAIGRSRSPSGGSGVMSGVDKLPVFLRSENIKSFVDKDLSVSTAPVKYLDKNGKNQIGYDAKILPQVAEVYLKARDAGVLLKNQEQIAKACDILMRGLAHVGIVALVDEATGFQRDRARDALAKILDAFIKDELGKWAKRFPDEFYAELFRLKGLTWPSDKNPPQYVGHLTNNLVYKRLAPNVLEELKTRSPKNAKGNRNNRFHQWLTNDIGHPRLQEHISAVIALMKSCDDWEDFQLRLNRSLPKYEPVPLFDEIDP